MSRLEVMNEADKTKEKTNTLYKHGFTLMDISEQKYLIIADHEGFNNSCFLAKDVNELEAFIEVLTKDKEESE